MAEPQSSSVFEYNNKIKIVAVMNMNNLTHTLVDYFDVGSFHATIFKYTRDLGLWLVQPTIIYYGIGLYKAALQKNIATVSGTMTYVLTTYEK